RGQSGGAAFSGRRIAAAGGGGDVCGTVAATGAESLPGWDHDVPRSDHGAGSGADERAHRGGPADTPDAGECRIDPGDWRRMGCVAVAVGAGSDASAEGSEGYAGDEVIKTATIAADERR